MPGIRWLYLAVFASSFDRYVVPPVLIAVAASFGVSVGEAAVLLTVYLVASGLLQLPWGVLGDRIGRRRALRISSYGAAVGGVVCAVAPNLPALAAGRLIIGVMGAGMICTVFVVVGDGVPFERRHRVIADVLAANILATSLATLSAGVLADTLGWRVAFVLPAIAAAVVGLAASRAVVDDARPGEGEPPPRLRAVLRDRWARTILLVGMLDGAAIHGVVSYFPPAVESSGTSATVAGATVSTIGLAMLGATLLLRRVAPRVSGPALILAGGASAALAYVITATDQRPLVVLCVLPFVGIAFAFMHATIQAWASEAVPWARATVTGLFGTGLLLGAALSAAALAPLAGAGEYGLLFAAGAVFSLGSAVACSLRRRTFGIQLARGRPEPAGDPALPGQTLR